MDGDGEEQATLSVAAPNVGPWLLMVFRSVAAPTAVRWLHPHSESISFAQHIHPMPNENDASSSRACGQTPRHTNERVVTRSARPNIAASSDATTSRSLYCTCGHSRCRIGNAATRGPGLSAAFSPTAPPLASPASPLVSALD
ncbi:hypothetical protein BAUCODRAFT_333105 [Baudoinia panamericana UAMH 10762]|uniref:Uncharacterized protein n=1 Tax=Baudoinia panamericana (strain UAMH 10762) TaxID=717646 RepID=M2M3C1_BAUPA|nr:uncharacterized protein BAUCODRAFT_333105 [Baudoinia panamericana UAMH 10762]EMC91011.1 hypothetical protein BAUCODRAFT_333105 [Baudoinia panamericana UAMH 10762]